MRTGRFPLQIHPHLFLREPTFVHGQLDLLLFLDQNGQLSNKRLLRVVFAWEYRVIDSRIIRWDQKQIGTHKKYQLNTPILTEIALAHEIRDGILVTTLPLTNNDLRGVSVHALRFGSHPTDQFGFSSIPEFCLQG